MIGPEGEFQLYRLPGMGLHIGLYALGSCFGSPPGLGGRTICVIIAVRRYAETGLGLCLQGKKNPEKAG